ncbi:MAG TPA: hypothetical protein VFA98_11600 [Thermoanaerobaculia bacterium]|nr:hypothetical protein [Thermoanaerobaculia bacterium]
MSNALERYLALVKSLLKARAAAGDHLSEEEEDRCADELDDAGRVMTEAEQEASREPIEAMKRETEPKWAK